MFHGNWHAEVAAGHFFWEIQVHEINQGDIFQALRYTGWRAAEGEIVSATASSCTAPLPQKARLGLGM